MERGHDDRSVDSMRSLAAIAILAVALTAPAAPASAGKFTATLTGSTHRPHAGKAMHYTVKVRRHGKGIRAKIKPLFVYQGLVVGSEPARKIKGRYRDSLTWPKRAIGYPLTFRIRVKTKYGTRNLDWWIRVRS